MGISDADAPPSHLETYLSGGLLLLLFNITLATGLILVLLSGNELSYLE